MVIIQPTQSLQQMTSLKHNPQTQFKKHSGLPLHNPPLLITTIVTQASFFLAHFPSYKNYPIAEHSTTWQKTYLDGKKSF